jgi:hypothetical protein
LLTAEEGYQWWMADGFRAIRDTEQAVLDGHADLASIQKAEYPSKSTTAVAK